MVMAYDGLTMVNLPERQNLAKLDVPILVVEGKKDNLFSPMAAHKLAKTLIGGRPHHQVRQLVFETGHCTQIEAPNQFNSVLFDFAQDPERYVATHGTSEEYRQAHQEQQNPFVI
ncbi:MAG: alpha/beta hydrolase [Hymenobacter sp.]